MIPVVASRKVQTSQGCGGGGDVPAGIDTMHVLLYTNAYAKRFLIR
jgi:hypothetical protein